MYYNRKQVKTQANQTKNHNASKSNNLANKHRIEQILTALGLVIIEQDYKGYQMNFITGGAK